MLSSTFAKRHEDLLLLMLPDLRLAQDAMVRGFYLDERVAAHFQTSACPEPRDAFPGNLRKAQTTFRFI